MPIARCANISARDNLRRYPPLLQMPCGVFILTTVLSAYGSIYMTASPGGVNTGESATFECLRTGNHQPIKIRSWLVDGRSLSLNSRINTSHFPYNNRLTINGAVRSDSGRYTCVTDGRHKASQNFIVYCTVVPFRMPVTRAVAGTNVSLRCDGQCYEYIFWARNDGYFVDELEPERFYSPGNGSILYITNVSIADNGSFTCEFLAGKTAYAKVELLVKVPATKVTVYKSSRASQVGHDYQVTCRSDGTPPSESVTWYNNSLPIHQTSRVTTHYNKETGISTLSIRPITRYDVSNIECLFKQEMLKGQFHYINASVHLIPKGKPDPPTDIIIEVIISNSGLRSSVQLSWTSPVYTGHLDMLAYRITFWDNNMCSQSTDCSEKEYWLPASVLSHDFDLQGYEKYSRLCFAVQSVNNDGLSDRSESACLGVSPPASEQPTLPPTTPKPSISGTKTQYPRPAVRTGFQVLLKNVTGLCSRTLKISEEILTTAIASHLSWLCSCVVLPSDVTLDSFTQLGGILYYRGILLHPHSDRLVANMSTYIMTERGRLRVSGNYMEFLSSCSTQMIADFCTVSQQDSSALRCSSQHDEGTEPATELPLTDSRSPWLVVSIVFGTLLLVSLGSLLFSLYFCYRKFGRAGKQTVQMSSSRKHILTCVNGNVASKEKRLMYSSQVSTSGSDVAYIDLVEASDRKTAKHPESRFCSDRNDSRDLRRQTEPCKGGTFQFANGKEREETRV